MLIDMKELERGITAKPHTQPYKIHRYFARRPWNVFNQLINLFSNESDIILDPFCGGGVTIYEGIRLGRKVVGFDINPLSKFIVDNMIKKEIDLISLKKDFEILCNYLKELYTPYEIIDTNQEQKTLIRKRKFIDWYELAHVVYCNHCHKKIILSNKNKLKNGRYLCGNTNCPGNKNNGGFVEPKNCERDGYKYLFSVTLIPKSRKRIIKKVDEDDTDHIEKHIKFLRRKIKKNDIRITKDKIPLNWDRQHEDLLKKKKINNFQDLFTERNLYVNLLLLNKIKSLNTSKKNYELLRFVFSDSLRNTNIMTFTNKKWQSGKPITWAKHAYWIPSQFCEMNVLYSFQKSFKSIEGAIRFNKRQSYLVKRAKNFSEILKEKNYYVVCDSIENSDIPENQIDAIITDPPYGSNVQYLELSHFWNVWNKDLYDKKKINFKKEAVANRKKGFKGAKSYYDYEKNLYGVFKKSYQVLKPGKYMILTFNNKDLNAWLALLISIFRAGFTIDDGGLYFQGGIKNYRQTAHTKAKGSPYGDFIYVFKKEVEKTHIEKDIDQNELIKLINNSANKYIHNYKKEGKERNKIKRRMFMEIIPYIEKFVKSNLQTESNHSLYDIYKKNFLGELYKKV